MTFWQWFQKKFCAHEWELVEAWKFEIKRRDTASVIGKRQIFHERCKACGTNNIKAFRQDVEW